MNESSTVAGPRPGPDPEGTLLVARVREGDPRAFAELVQRHQQRVYRLLLRLVRDPHRAEDLAQETFLQAWRSFDRFRGESRVSTWLLGIAINVARDHTPPRIVTLDADLALADHPAPDPDPSLQWQRRRVLEVLEEAVAALPDGLRETFVAVALEGMEYDEAAQTLGVPVGTVRSRLARARDRLREALAQQDLSVFGEPVCGQAAVLPPP